MGRLVAENGHRKDTCYNETELCAYNKDAILGSIVNITNGRAYAMI